MLALATVLGSIAGCGGNDETTIGIAMPTTVAGSGDAGSADGSPAVARFNNPVNVAVAADGSVYVADFDNGRIRKIATNGYVSTLVNQANFVRPFGLAVTNAGQLYAQTDGNDLGEVNSSVGTVWRIDLSTGVATVVARNLGRPRGLAALPDGDLVLSDLKHSTISRLNPTTGAVTLIAGKADTPGFADGNGSAAQFDRPYGVAVQADGSLLVADQNNNRIRRVTLAGEVTTYAGTGTAGAIDGPRLTATLNGPQDVAVDGSGRIYIADTTGHRIRRIVGNNLSTYAGNGVAGYVDADPLESEFFGLEGIDATKSGKLWIADGTGGEDLPYNRVRVIGN
jgi:sugar lactone lactonase YvrE